MAQTLYAAQKGPMTLIPSLWRTAVLMKANKKELFTMRKLFLLGSLFLGLGLFVVGCGDGSVTTEPPETTAEEEAAQEAEMEDSMAEGAALAGEDGGGAPDSDTEGDGTEGDGTEGTDGN
jgi:hypothetical protein